MTTLPRNKDGDIFDRLGLRYIWRSHILYNSYLLTLLGLFNRLRWPHTDIPFILWPPAREQFDAIERDIRSRYKILSVEDHRIDPERFSEFVQKAYAIDTASPAKIKIKLEHIVRPPLEIRIIMVRFPWPKMEVQDIFNRVRCKDAHALKDRIRADYRERVPDYIFDTIIHSTETANQGDELMELVHTYRKPGG